MGDTLEDFNTVSGRHAPKKWINEYTAGVGWEIYTTPLSPRFERRKFTELSYRIYKELGVLLFAVEVVEISTGKSRLLLNPGDYRIPSQNEFGLLAFVIAENQANADLTMASDAEAFRFTPTRAQSFHGSEKGSQGHGHGLGGGLGQGLEAVGQGLMGLVGGRKESIPSPTKKTGDSKGDNKGKLYHKPHSHQDMTNQLIEKMALQSVYARTVYMPKSSNSKHVVVCGDISSVSLEEFFGELFHDDHETVGLVAVLLLPTPPSSELVILMEHSPYFSSVLYLEGSALNDKDLKRAKAELALAVFIMSNKFSRKADEEDAKSILLKLSIKRYVKTFKAPRQLFCLQLIRPQNKKHLGQDEHELGIGADQRDLNICLSEIKMGILAKAVMYPGVNTLLMNLI
ncbi:hypothetical protein B484DRAFT_392857, partial [Ochromonadaceae sp. CCMP2298]